MKITVRTIGRLGAYLPRGKRENRSELPIDGKTTPADVMRRLGMSGDRLYLVTVNGRIVPQDLQASAVLCENDVMTILPKPKVG